MIVIMEAVRVGMAVVMLMAIERQGPLRARPKQGAIFRRGRNVFGRALATDMAVEADHPDPRRP